MNIIILMGGNNRRIGKEKAFLKIGNKTILKIMLEKLNQLRKKDDRIIIVADNISSLQGRLSKSKFFSQHGTIDVVSDLIPGAGPLGGIYSGLAASSTEYNLVLACDMPFLNVNLIQHMLRKKSDYDILIPKYGDCFEPLHAVYSKNILPVIKQKIEQESYRIQSIFSRVKVKYITERDMEKFGNWQQFFFNINTLSELKKARKIFKQSFRERGKLFSNLCITESLLVQDKGGK
ncbi:molybdenum cofactor guanylyltransferase [Candidatus Aerophobetes bacterium]|nr:molybdenum cofactor guanylyltransferase [Candidatus Aerophobetes bacterium]